MPSSADTFTGADAARGAASDQGAFAIVACGMALLSIAASTPWLGIDQHAVAAALDWQPSLAGTQIWRWWTASFVHLSNLHLVANLAGVALVGALGVVARAPNRVAWAWLIAMPLTHLGLLIEPGLTHYAGMSGALHAGVALVSVFVVCNGSPAQRWLGIAILLGVALKVFLESPSVGPVQHRAGWDIPIAPLAHATGFASGVLVGGALEALTQWRMRATRAVVE